MTTIAYLDKATLKLVQAMTERELQAEVYKLCADRGILVQHYENSLAGRPHVKGWPDLECVGPGGTFHRELKQQRESATTEQMLVGAAIIRSGGSWKVWKPSDFYSGRIALELDIIAERT